MEKNKLHSYHSVKNNRYFYKNLRVKVIGIGGGGGSIVKEIRSVLPNYNFISFTVANTDSQALNLVGHGVKRFLFGEELTHGLGCGMDDNLGEKAAELAKDRVSKEIANTDLVILISSLGGGTGSGASPVFARIARRKNKLVLGIFTLPFKFEKEQRLRIAQKALDDLVATCNAVFIIPNDSIFKIVDPNTSLKKAFSFINSNLAHILGRFLNMIYRPGLINVDFADFKTILEGSGKLIYLNSVRASGPSRAQEIIRKVLYNPLAQYNVFLQDKKAILGRKVDRILFNIEGGADLKMDEVNEISRGITGLHSKTKIIFGVAKSKKEDKGINVTLFAVFRSGTDKEKKGKIKKQEGKKERKRAVFKKTKKALKTRSRKAGRKKTVVSISRKPVRRSAIEVKKEEKKAEKELLEEEERLDIPAFLRQKTKR